MSRTYRRIHHPDAHTLTELEWVDNGREGRYLCWRALDFQSPEYAQRKAQFHADHNSGTHNAPKWYRTVHNRAFRARANHAVRTWRDDEELLLARKPSNSNYEWF